MGDKFAYIIWTWNRIWNGPQAWTPMISTEDTGPKLLWNRGALRLLDFDLRLLLIMRVAELP